MKKELKHIYNFFSMKRNKKVDIKKNTKSVYVALFTSWDCECYGRTEILAISKDYFAIKEVIKEFKRFTGFKDAIIIKENKRDFVEEEGK